MTATIPTNDHGLTGDPRPPLPLCRAAHGTPCQAKPPGDRLAPLPGRLYRRAVHPRPTWPTSSANWSSSPARR
jgi:hypothetical protein